MVTYVKEFENLILSEHPEDAMTSVVIGSQAELYIKLMSLIKHLTDTGKIHTELYPTLAKYKQRTSSEIYNEAYLRILLKEYDIPDTTKERKEEIIKAIKDTFYPGYKYDYPKPMDIHIADVDSNLFQSNYPNMIDESMFKPELIVKDYLANPKDTNILSKIRPEFLTQFLDFNAMPEDFFRELLLGRIPITPYELSDSSLAILARKIDTMCNETHTGLSIAFLLNRMTLVQLEKLLDLITTLYFDKNEILDILINKKYQSQLEKLPGIKEQQDILCQIYEVIKDKGARFAGYKSCLLLEILEKGRLLGVFDVNLFKEYLKSPTSYSDSVNRLSMESKVEISQRKKYNILGQTCIANDRKIIDEYLKNFFLLNEIKIEEFEEYLNTDYLMRCYYKALVMKGQDSDEIIRYLGNTEYENLVKSTEITICDHNKQCFDIHELVELEVDVKNVQSLFIKIFEINTENYYYNTKSPISTTISLEGLITKSEDTFFYNEKPQRLIRRKYILDKIPQKRGLYIIEMIGSGYSSRAIVKKGGLNIVSRSTSEGKMIFILNENSEICKGEGTGLWFNNRFYTCDDKYGKVVIPYMRQTVNEPCVIMHEGFAELASLEVTEENYELKGEFYVQHESLMMGNTAKILFRPYLYINGREMPVDFLKNCKITAKMTKMENDVEIPISNMFEKITPSPMEEIQFELQIPPKLTRIELYFEGEISNKSKEKNEKLCLRQTLSMNSSQEDNQFLKMYLRKPAGAYILSLLGKNGEAKVDHMVRIVFIHQWISQHFEQVLQTNSNGEISLGKLNHIRGITASIEGYSGETITQQWIVPSNVEFSYPSTVDMLTGEKLSLPIVETCINQENVSFIRMQNNSDVIEDHAKDLVLMPCNEEKTRFNLEISNIPPGLYQLTLKRIEKSIKIEVHEGMNWETKNFIIDKKKIVENSEWKDPIYVSDVKIDHANNNVVIKIGSRSKNYRAHVFLFQFLHHTPNAFFNNVKNIIHSAHYHSVHTFQNWANFYLSNRQISDEIQYVFDRKNLERYIGNSLEKPSLLVKRQFIRNTTTEAEVLGQGTQFEEKKAEIARPTEDRAIYRKDSYGQSCPLNLYSDFHNFLANSPLIFTNLRPNEKNEIVIENCPLGLYSQMQIVAFDERSLCNELLSLPLNKIITRNLTLTQALNCEKNFSELRKSQMLTQGTDVVISDITSTSFKIIDSLEKIVSYQNLVSPHLQQEWNKFQFLLKLGSDLSTEEILKKFSSFFCHELNLFLYFKHPDLFEQYVLPVIKFKCEKTFIDFFLLNDKDNLMKFISPVRIQNLSSFELCLLIYKVRKDCPELAKNLRNRIFQRSESSKVRGEEMKRYFNIMMNMKLEEESSTGSNVVLPPSMPQPHRQLMVSNMFQGAQRLADFSDEYVERGMMNNLMMVEPVNEQVQFQCMNVAMEDAFDYCEEKAYDEFQGLQQRNARNNLYKNPGSSKEYCETHFFKNIQGAPCFYSNTPLWVDLADHLMNNPDLPLAKNFLSKHILIPSSQISELLAVLALIDLPAVPATHQFLRKEGRSLQIVSGSNLILFTKEIAETQAKINTKLMIAQSISELNKKEDIVIKEYLVNKVYTHETIVTNISSRQVLFELLIQIPEGAIPVMNSEYTKTIHSSLNPFTTISHKTFFYFPAVGTFVQYPPNVAIEGQVIARGEPLQYEVVKTIKSHIKESLDNVLETGGKNDILEFFAKREAIKAEELEKVYWLLKEKDFFVTMLNILRSKGIYNANIWAFGFYHKDEQALKEFMQAEKSRIKQLLGPSFSSTLVNINHYNNQEVMYHLDYHPLFNARVHKLGHEANSEILNKEFKETYQKFITYLITVPQIDARSWLRLSYYLILQDRIEEALKVFSRIDPGRDLAGNHSWVIQYDYIAAYLDFSFGYPDFTAAKAICQKYKNFPLQYWKEMFEEIEDQLIEYEGKEIVSDIDAIIDEERKKKQMIKNVKMAEPKLSFAIENKALQIMYSNIDTVTVKFYLIDLEILFSRTPFLKSNTDDFSFVQPNFVRTIVIDDKTKGNEDKVYSYPIPDEYLTKNLFIEVSSISKKAFETYFSTSLKVSISENLGEIKVVDTSMKPLSKVYVKCFAKMKDESVKFYKDGYTDLRGKFNYLTLNTDQIKSLKKFSVLITHDTYGSIIKECNPPANIQQGEAGADYENLQNYRQEVKQVWRTMNKSNI